MAKSECLLENVATCQEYGEQSQRIKEIQILLKRKLLILNINSRIKVIAFLTNQESSKKVENILGTRPLW